VQFGQSLYNQMMTDMGLNISETPDAGNKTVENTEPNPQETRQATHDPEERPAASRTKWIVAGGIVVLLLIVTTILVLFVLRSSLA
jgi:hypothetical protein